MITQGMKIEEVRVKMELRDFQYKMQFNMFLNKIKITNDKIRGKAK